MQGEGEEDLAEKGGEDFAGDEGRGGTLGAEGGVWAGPTHEDGNGKDEKEVNKEKLLISL